MTTSILVKIKQNCERKFCLHFQDFLLRRRLIKVCRHNNWRCSFLQNVGNFLPGGRPVRPRRQNIYIAPLLGSLTITSRDFKEMTVNTFTAIVDLSRFNNSCLKSPTSTLVDLTFQSLGALLFQLKSAT